MNAFGRGLGLARCIVTLPGNANSSSLAWQFFRRVTMRYRCPLSMYAPIVELLSIRAQTQAEAIHRAISKIARSAAALTKSKPSSVRWRMTSRFTHTQRPKLEHGRLSAPQSSHRASGLPAAGLELVVECVAETPVQEAFGAQLEGLFRLLAREYDIHATALFQFRIFTPRDAFALAN